MRRSYVDIVFEDSDILVVDKPAGMIVHPAPGYPSGTLLDVLLEHAPKMAGVGSETRPGIVHRLDIETSGVMVVAKTERAYHALREAFESHEAVRKTYLAVVHGAFKTRTGTVETLIGRKPWDPHRMAVVERDGKRAVTHWNVLQRHGMLTLVEFTIETGRTHQIRVHAAHLGHPVVGDALYGDRAKDRRVAVRPGRHLLHAVQLEFPHPVTGKMVSFAARPPDDMLYVRG